MKNWMKYSKNICFKNIFFVVFITIIFVSCVNPYRKTSISGSKIAIDTKIDSKKDIEQVIAPYKKIIDQDLNEPISNINETLDKSKGKWQSKMSVFFADACFERADIAFQDKFNKKIDICIMNNGGIRSILPAGVITKKNAFEIMPFENSAVVCELKGEQLLEFLDSFVKEGKPHPISGMTFTIQNKKAENIKVNGNFLDPNAKYNVLTNDYLAEGGDNMTFFKKRTNYYDLNYKLRNILIDYFNNHKNINVLDKKIIEDLDSNNTTK